jgi:hypothetical protein
MVRRSAIISTRKLPNEAPVSRSLPVLDAVDDALNRQSASGSFELPWLRAKRSAAVHSTRSQSSSLLDRVRGGPDNTLVPVPLGLGATSRSLNYGVTAQHQPRHCRQRGIRSRPGDRGGRVTEDGPPTLLAADPDSHFRAILDAEDALRHWRRLRMTAGSLTEITPESGEGAAEGLPLRSSQDRSLSGPLGE